MSVEDVRNIWSQATLLEASSGSTVKGESQTASRASRLVVKPHAVVDVGKAAAPEADYELLERIGEGGIGVVYAARQTSIDRTIAFKMLKPERADDEDTRQRFLSEAAVTGDLDHPNIVPVYDLGANDAGALFYAMKRVRGRRWRDVLRDKSVPENLDILLRVADAVAFAHSRSVIHRDLKPSNVMLGDFGEVLLMDWGLAAPADERGKVAAADAGAGAAGTPSYMAPEMVVGDIERIGFRSDVYLLGAILYEILTHRPPHSGKDVIACLVAAGNNEIQPSERDDELFHIALKAMATEPEERHASVKAFQAAIREYESHSESVTLSAQAAKRLAEAQKSKDYDDYGQALFGYREALSLWEGNAEAQRGASAAKLAYARCAFAKGDLDLAESLLDSNERSHVGLAEEVSLAREKRDARRRRVRVLTAVSASLAAMIFITVVVGFFWIRAERAETEAARKKAETEREKAILSEAQARIEKKRAEREREKAVAARKQAETERHKAVAAEQEAREQRDQAVREGYYTKIGMAQKKIEEGNILAAERLLASCPRALRHWEWGWLKRICHMEVATLRGVPGNVYSLAYSPDGTQIVSGGYGGITIWDAATRRERFHTKTAQTLRCVAFSPDGEHVASGGQEGGIRIWRAADGQQTLSLQEKGLQINSLAYSPDGTRLASASHDKTLRVWDAGTGEELLRLDDHGGGRPGSCLQPGRKGPGVRRRLCRQASGSRNGGRHAYFEATRPFVPFPGL